jgi:hypothetical protein
MEMTYGSAKGIGRIVGILFIVQGTVAWVANFVLLGPALSPAATFLASAAASPTQVRWGVILGLANGALNLAVAIAAWHVFRPRTVTMALGYLALAITGCCLLAFENVAVLTMLSISEEYAKAGAARDLLQASGLVARSLRHWTHYTNLICAGGMVFVFYVVLWRFALVPRLLAGFGVAAALLQATAVTLPLFGHPIDFRLIAPLGVIQLAVAVWLIAKGFPEQRGVTGQSPS